jgi:diguanylate cyclase (GGDEF)-like protein/PAS domain S-box-containing protein
MQHLKRWHLNLYIVLSSLVLSEVCVALLSLLMFGEIRPLPLQITLVVTLFASPILALIFTHLLDEIGKTQLQNLENTAHRTRHNLEMAIEAAQMDLWEFDLTTYTIKYNTARLKIPGFTADDPPRDLSAWLSSIHPDDVGAFQQRMHQAMLPDAANFDFEYRVSLNEGQWTWVHTRGGIIGRDALGKPILAAGSTINITERKQAELQLSQAVEAAQMILWELELGTGVLRFDDSKLHWLGANFQGDAHTISSWLSHIHPDDQAAFIEKFQHVLNTPGTKFDYEYRLKSSNGSWVWVQTQGQISLRNALGEATLAAGGTLNIQARKLAEDRLLKNESLLRATLESTDEGILMIGHDGHVLSANKRFVELWHIPQSIAESGRDDLLLGHVLEQLVDPNVFLDQVKRLYDSDEEARDTLHFKDGRVFARFTQTLTIGEERGRIWCFKDISEQYHAEAELKATKERYDFANQVGKVGTWDWSPLTGMLFWSDETFRLMGYKPGSITPSYELYLQQVHPADRAFLNDSVQAALQQKKPYSLDCRIILGDASEIVCHVTGKVEFDSNDQPIRMLGTIQDVTERKRVELALADSRNLLKTVIDTSPIRVFWKDRDLRYLGCNPAFAKDAGRPSPEELLGKDDFEMSWGAQAELYRTDDKQVMDSGIAKLSYDEPQTTPEGDTIWLRTSKVPLRNDTGDTIGILGIYEDITDRKQAEIALKISEQKLLTILDNVDAYIYLKDTAGKYLFANRPVRELWGAEMEDIVGFGDEKFFDEATTENIRSNDRGVLDRGESHTTEETNTVVATGKCFTYLSTKLPLRREDGSIYALCGVSTDITQRKHSELALQASEARAQTLSNLLRLITDNVTDMIWAKDLNKHYLFANKAICTRLLNAQDTDEPIGKDDMFFAMRERNSRPHDPSWHTFGELCQDSDVVTLQNGKASQFDEYGNVQGKFLFLDVHKAPFINDKGEVIGVVGSGRDVTQQKIIEEKLRLASMVLENSSEAMFITDENAVILEVNPAFTLLTGYLAVEAIGMNPKLLRSGKHDAAFYAAMQKELKQTGHWQGEIWNRRKSGEIFAEWQTINTIYNEDGSIHRHVALFSDITEKKKSEELIWAQANFDQLTDLPNRRMFRDRLAQDIKKAHRAGLGLALLFLDLDRFKEVNDSLGHDTGDALLIEAAQRISACVRESDTVARLGGDEFTIILAELDDRASVERIATEILRSLTQPFELGEHAAYVSASIGITMYPDDATNLEDMLKNADQAMYVAKNAGRNRFSYFTNAMQESALYRLHMLNDLRNALAEQQFKLHYQPIVEIHTGRIHKAEALLRWFHPKRGLISPAEFIPLAEESGLIHEIGDWVFEQAVAQTQKWIALYDSDFQISVNKSPIQIQTKSECCRWKENLAKTGLSGKNLVIEITEGVLLDSSPVVISELLAFRDADIQVAIDDFGTGYSALSYLKKLDIDYVKIDQSFILNLEADDNDKALAEAIVVMAHKLGLKVIAEGVETQPQLDLLAKMGCDYAQGFLYSRALAPQEFEKLLASFET